MLLKSSFAALLALAASFAQGQVVVDQMVGYATLGSGTTGGAGGPTVTVTTCTELIAAVKEDTPAIVRVNPSGSTLTSCGIIRVGSNKTILGAGYGVTIKDGGFRLYKESNIIIRNFHFDVAPEGKDAVELEQATQVWVDHCTFNTVGLTGDKDDYDGLLDAKRASDWITFSWNKFLDHWKGSLVGHSDSNESQDSGKLHITYHHNYWNTINSRTPSYRFGTGHVYSSCYLNIGESGINSRMGAEVLVENNYFENAPNCIATNLFSDEEGYVHERNNIFGPGATTSITQNTTYVPPYAYAQTPASQACSVTLASAGVGVLNL